MICRFSYARNPRLKSWVIIFSFCIFHSAFADEGMWLPLFLKQLNEADMQKMGLKIPVDKIYSVNQSSLKDAVVLFGGGCTGEIISDQGLLLANHHCGFSSIQAQSSVDHDYINNGYWALSQEQELQCPNLTVTFIIRMEDVSIEINKELNDSMSEEERTAKILQLSFLLEDKAVQGTHYKAKVRSFFNGNQFFLFVTEVFQDIRLVGAPPNAIGDFGGDEDNWMYPRHTGDFSVFRVYADKNNKPAPYSKDNIPFKPRYHFTISLKGVKPGDFTMVYGFPGSTQEYLPSYAIDQIEKNTDAGRIKIRETRLQIMDAGMRVSDTVRTQYVAKEKKLNNYNKKWKGEVRGLKRLNTSGNKKEFEMAFSDWVITKNKTQYKNLLSDFEKTYKEFNRYSIATEYYNEAALGIEMIAFAKNFQNLAEITLSKNSDAKSIKEEAAKLKTGSAGYFKNYDVRIDKNVCVALLQLFYNDVEKTLHPDVFKTIENKYHGDFKKYTENVFAKSIFVSQEKVNKLLDNYDKKSVKKIVNDPGFLLMKSFVDNEERKIDSMYNILNGQIKKLNRLYMAAQMKMQQNKKFYPDANLTLRLTYGRVSGYEPRNGVQYKYATTLEGLMEKEDSTKEEFIVPQKLKELYAKKDYGRYGTGDTMPLDFIATNHTTGGNSGSPVINANGELIGLNFDRVWEGTMSDLQYDPEQCRNIAMDIRYTLFIIDKFAGCKRLIDEMSFAE